MMSEDNTVPRQPYTTLKQHMDEFIRGEISSEQLKPHFAPSGIYEQRNGAFMVRVRITGGHIDLTQLRGLGQLMDNLSIPYAHLSSRQDIQLHDVPADKVHDAMLACDQLGLPFKGGGGNTYRNIAVTADSGFAPGQAFDVMPYALQLNEAMQHYEKAFTLPRKLKIGYFTEGEGEFLAAQQDLGFLATIQDGRAGFKVYGGGGMGRESGLGVVLADFIPAEQHVRCAIAMTQLFDQHGNREDRHKARIRFILKERGEDAFRALFQQFLAEDKTPQVMRPEAIAIEAPAPNAAPASPASGFETWRAHAAEPCATTAFSSVKLYVPYGNLNGDQIQRVADLAESAHCAFVRLTRDQDILLPGVQDAALPALHRALVEDFPDLDLALTSFKGHITSCVGCNTCKIGILPAPELADRIAIAADSLLPADTEEKRAKLRILTTQVRISGCPNCCAGHPAARIGIQGQKKQIEGQSVPVGVFFTGACDVPGRLRLSTAKNSLQPTTLEELPSRVMSLLES